MNKGRKESHYGSRHREDISPLLSCPRLTGCQWQDRVSSQCRHCCRLFPKSSLHLSLSLLVRHMCRRQAAPNKKQTIRFYCFLACEELRAAAGYSTASSGCCRYCCCDCNIHCCWQKATSRQQQKTLKTLKKKLPLQTRALHDLSKWAITLQKCCRTHVNGAQAKSRSPNRSKAPILQTAHERI